MRLPPRENNRLAWCLLALGIVLALLWLWLMLTATRAHAAPRETDPTATIPGYEVGEFFEPPVEILRTLNGKTTVTLEHLLHQWPDITAPVEALRIVNTKRKQSNYGRLVSAIALRLGIQGIPNRRYYSKPRIACAAFVSYVMVKAGGRPYSFAVNSFYPQARKRGATLIATRVSTRYTPYYAYLKGGDLIFYHRGNRLGHLEIFVGGGKTVGTSSSKLRLGVRPIGNRGFSTMSVLRL